jgi:hypothetical protein
MSGAMPLKHGSRHPANSDRSTGGLIGIENLAQRKIWRRYWQKVLLPVDILPVMPIAGISSHDSSAIL